MKKRSPTKKQKSIARQPHASDDIVPARARLRYRDLVRAMKWRADHHDLDLNQEYGFGFMIGKFLDAEGVEYVEPKSN